MGNVLVDIIGKVGALTQYITWLHDDRALLEKLSAVRLRFETKTTWYGAGLRLLEAD